MKQATLIVIFSLATIGPAYAQAWPNAAPSPYGNPAAGQGTTAAPPAAPASNPTTTNGVELGTPPHALGAAAPSSAALAAQATPRMPAVADLDNPQGGRATAALNVLEAQGYADFSEFQPAGNAFTALVHDGGQQFRVVINPDTGQISRQ